MKWYLVQYYYLATGMEGIADRRIEGEVQANSKAEAVDDIIIQNYSHYNAQDRDFIRGCLSAIQIVKE